MEVNDRERLIILDLIKIAWQAGVVRGEQQADEIKALRVKFEQVEKKPCSTDVKGPVA